MLSQSPIHEIIKIQMSQRTGCRSYIQSLSLKTIEFLIIILSVLYQLLLAFLPWTHEYMTYAFSLFVFIWYILSYSLFLFFLINFILDITSHTCFDFLFWYNLKTFFQLVNLLFLITLFYLNLLIGKTAISWFYVWFLNSLSKKKKTFASWLWLLCFCVCLFL